MSSNLDLLRTRCRLLLICFLAVSAFDLACLPQQDDSSSPEPGTPDTQDRIIALGDLHGDLSATREALALAGIMDEDDHWCGGSTVLVQTGDILDRGDDEIAIFELLWQLQEEAILAGGNVHILNANHEMLNIDLNFRYVTDAAFSDFAGVDGVAQILAEAAGELPRRPGIDYDAILELPEEERARGAAFVPGGPYALRLAEHSVAIVIGKIVFVHGGLRPAYATYGVDQLNAESREWLLGNRDRPEWVTANKGPLWSRDFSREVDEDDCLMLERSLAILGVGRMVVGHTVHDSITSYCDGWVWCIDVGMSEHYGGPVQVLEFLDGEPRVLGTP